MRFFARSVLVDWERKKLCDTIITQLIGRSQPEHLCAILGFFHLSALLIMSAIRQGQCGVKRHEKYKGVSSLTNSGEEETERLKKMRVYCKIYGVYEGFRVLEMFDPMVGKVWSSTGEFFPMYDPETNEIFECGFNSAFSTVVAYAEIDVKDFREKLKECAQEVIEKRVREAIEKASNEVAPLWMLAEFF